MSLLGHCVKCEKGEFAPLYAEECEVCPTGYLAHHKGMDSCHACPIGRFGLLKGLLPSSIANNVLPESILTIKVPRNVSVDLLAIIPTPKEPAPTNVQWGITLYHQARQSVRPASQAQHSPTLVPLAPVPVAQASSLQKEPPVPSAPPAHLPSVESAYAYPVRKVPMLPSRATVVVSRVHLIR
jgi:hypothetical protein